MDKREEQSIDNFINAFRKRLFRLSVDKKILIIQAAEAHGKIGPESATFLTLAQKLRCVSEEKAFIENQLKSIIGEEELARYNL